MRIRNISIPPPKGHRNKNLDCAMLLVAITLVKAIKAIDKLIYWRIGAACSYLIPKNREMISEGHIQNISAVLPANNKVRPNTIHRKRPPSLFEGSLY